MPRPPSQGASLQLGVLGMLMAQQALRPTELNGQGHGQRLALLHPAARTGRAHSRLFIRMSGWVLIALRGWSVPLPYSQCLPGLGK